VPVKSNSKIQIKEWIKTPEGFLKIPVVVISEEVLDYPEFGTKEYVGPDIYSDKFLKQIEGYPFVLEHPVDENGRPVDVDSENFKKYIKGALFNPEAQKDKKRTIAELIVYDKNTVEAIESGDIKELSAKYESQDVKENGTFDGKPYNVKQTNMILNHLALTEAGRAGDKVKVLISKQNSKRSNNMADEEKDLEEGKDKQNQDMAPPEGAEHEAEEEETLQSISEKVDALTELMTAVVDKIGGVDKPKVNEDTTGSTIDEEKTKGSMEVKHNSLTAADVQGIIAENNEIMQAGKSAIGNDIYMVAQKYNSSNDAIMRHVLVALGEYDAVSVKKLNSIQLRSEFKSATKFAKKLNSMQASNTESFAEVAEGSDFMKDVKHLQG